MADPLKQMCDELGVCTEEALFYLEGFRWDLNAAMEACRSKTLPSPSLTAQPPSSENERAAAEEPGENENATGASVEEARSHLSRNNGNVDNACSSFLEHPLDQPEKKSKPVPLSHDGDNEGSGVMQDVLSKVPQFPDTSTRTGSPPWSSTASFRRVQKCMNLFNDVVSSASLQDVTDCLNKCKGDVDVALLYYYHVCDKKEELIASFSSTTEATREVAKFYLEQYKWNLDRAVGFFFEHGDSEKQKSLEEGGEGDVTVAIPGGEAAEETTVETQTAPSTITITIRLGDTSGTLLELPFRPDQTIRDIRNAIDQRYPDNDRGYILQSMDGVDYMDWSITVHRVSTVGAILFQLYP